MGYTGGLINIVIVPNLLNGTVSAFISGLYGLLWLMYYEVIDVCAIFARNSIFNKLLDLDQ